MAGVPALNSFLIDGGRGAGGQGSLFTQDPTQVYNATAKEWAANIDNRNRILVDSHSAVTGPNNVIYISGGRSSKMFNNQQGEMQFPGYMMTFNIATLRRSSEADLLPSPSPLTRLNHRGVLSKDGRTIFYIGGLYPLAPTNENRTDYSYAHVNMSSILTFDTVNAKWGERNATGLEPSARVDHTLSIKPSTGELILYGGRDPDDWLARDDYFYILNTDTMEWSNRTIGVSGNAKSAGRRFAHSAVLVGDKSLFIIWGLHLTGDYQLTQPTTNDLCMLDVETWTWTNDPPVLSLAADDGTVQYDDGNGKLSPGAIAGIVIGAVAAVN
ncbi:hypothetical protein BJV82DRAFT_589800 [Fennellomyces sp. T-0311]|nr:hypothetical protein BJV82DRAFT_589800 [Fennellomyces sp. T-0311]